MARKKTYVLDTSVYLTDFNSIYAFRNNDIIVPFKVLEEVDKHKKRQDTVGVNARRIIRIFDDLRRRGSLNKGVRLKRGQGIVRVRGYDKNMLPEEYSIVDPDNQIIATAVSEAAGNERKVIVVSRDINMRVKCDAIGLTSEDYHVGKVIRTADEIFTGFATHLIDDQIIDRFYDGAKILLEKQDIYLQPNQFLMLVSNSNEKKTCLARFINYATPLLRINGEFNTTGIWGVKPRNKEQSFALNLLLDPKVEIVSLVGKAGSGKTLCALAAGLEQLLEPMSRKRKNTPKNPPPDGQTRYNRLIVTRPVQPLGKDIGFLPGTMEEKMAPWLMPIQDNLQFLLGDDKTTLQMYMDNGTIEIEALTYIRGRSISNAFIIVDEAQNLTKHELKTIITRVGEGSKIVLTGDIEQIDNTYIDETSNGLTYAVEKLKRYELSGHVTLTKGERSKVATLGAKVL